jgi:hypothetical protein
MRLVKVTWVDAYVEPEWTVIHKMNVQQMYLDSICISYGYLTHEFPNVIVIAGTLSGNQVNNILMLPKGMILEITDISDGHLQHLPPEDPDQGFSGR